MDQYAKLLELGKPNFIEIKDVTYCESSGASSLTLKNVPYHADVWNFGEGLCKAAGDRYGLACEHAHSCCILLACKDMFWRDEAWHTWIDYEKFHVGRSLCDPALCPIIGWGTYHIPPHKQAGGYAALTPDIHVSGDKSIIPESHTVAVTNDTAVRVGGCGNKGIAEGCG